MNQTWGFEDLKEGKNLMGAEGLIDEQMGIRSFYLSTITMQRQM